MAASRRQVRLTPLAESDLEDIWRYTSSNWSVDQADRYHRDLLSTIGALARGLKTGRICSVRAGYWRYTAGSHVIFYRDTDHTLDVIRILHQRMDVDRHL
ncbi:type II toxin-antitoxin system RelE/ParE family toxin [Paraburkholderia sp. UCT2]|uniref:type II toxin-antitoxin system RelE/ParE family toxin n=1 Tax=Paraburkholderia sp. UCT2 TaxID=2615208 RepID=UPI0016558E7B|nr:type II toxin-antitoxin system RelE/ParE family toxin [Paraburkholderia sp. UCT2]MBC8732857.1 type II toxin-antitoxin system RelE/ParE family toxin [Paraburkholderia sp. UCT2]